MSITHFEASQFSVSSVPSVNEELHQKANDQAQTQELPEQEVREFELKKLTALVRDPAKKVTRQSHIETQNDAERRAQAVHKDRFKLSQLAKEAMGEDEKEKQRADILVKNRIEAETEAARAMGIKEGYVEGLARGKEEALAEYRKTSGEKIDRIVTLLKSMEEAKVAIFEANQNFLIDLSFRVGRSVLLRELITDREYVTRLTRDLLERTDIRDNLTIKLNPADAALADELKSGLHATFSNLRNLAIETSSEVRGGGVVMESEWGAIDASIDTQLSNLHAALQSPVAKDKG
jgi:flagellar assembly protein FliH